MVAPTAMFILLALLAVEGLVLWVDQLHRTRREAAYWHQRDNRPSLYDWQNELDL